MRHRSSPRRILGIDPGLRITGYGVITVNGSRLAYVGSGIIRIPDGPLPERLNILFEQLAHVLAQYEPVTAAVEQVFVHRNPSSALKLGHARGAAICACAQAGLTVAEYTPRRIKQALVGTGNADKQQVQYMVQSLLGLRGNLRVDAADALATAVCHAHGQRFDCARAGEKLIS
ncbi:crossover junction endodeoxyribonuclease RuvC [Nitrococcus mobilis]|uniref:Crossover junction endodeoxyribonuclease RuvC n=1 Tax=Nitrococcus mobilis Nb-231 TaxID=314278 RepID=A4BPD8_9GAMM|nr:crossover junction endodeoxyribonuclease RuvC [Nitrococcus mobilis]EAR22439.1 Crossover junction endodeoxyribonuclease RuvC [Nitrococcus mobilis Nb-231]